MTVRDFIEELKKLDQDTQICVATPIFNGAWDETLSIAEGQIFIDDISNPKEATPPLSRKIKTNAMLAFTDAINIYRNGQGN